MVQLNKQCKINFSKVIYSVLPVKAVNLLREMLEPEPLKRITAEKALQHPFITGIEYIPPMIPRSDSDVYDEDVHSEEDILILKQNIDDFMKLDKKTLRFIESLNKTTTNLGIGTKLPLIESSTNDEKKEYNEEVLHFSSTKKFPQDCTIIITRTPVLNGHVKTFANSPVNRIKTTNSEEFSPSMKKDLSFHKKGTAVNFTLMAIACEK